MAIIGGGGGPFVALLGPSESSRTRSSPDSYNDDEFRFVLLLLEFSADSDSVCDCCVGSDADGDFLILRTNFNIPMQQSSSFLIYDLPSYIDVILLLNIIKQTKKLFFDLFTYNIKNLKKILIIFVFLKIKIFSIQD